MRTSLILLMLFACAGCAPYARVQIDLLEQAYTGVARSRQSLEQKSRIVAAYHQLRRRQLDDAFDADVRARAQLSPEWVIEHRRAYSTALDAIASAKTQSELAADAERRNVAAVERALQQVIFLQSIAARLSVARPLGASQETDHEPDDR
jgi:hypothetical protein